MFLFYFTNLVFLVSFTWLLLTNAGLMVWGVWIAGWFISDYAVMYITGYEPPNWFWTVIIALLAIIWGGVTLLYGG